uniref:Uncharacterized protein n=1 Tax=Kalanchoe fedtschenkoi TaxID=63787 RepID=A0A7N0RGB5_KALFE
MGRAPCCDKTLVKKGPWAPEEDAMLKAYIDAHGTGGNWIALPQKIGLRRCGKSCRLRWLNYLRPNIKHGGFSDEEDNVICSLYISIGSRWSVIAAQLPGRTDNDIKNYWNTKLKKKLLGRRKQCNNIVSSSSSSTMEDTKDGMSDETQRLSNSALERLQLHIQLQNRPRTLNSVNGPTAHWPKLLHPAQERMIRSLTESQNDINTPHQHKLDKLDECIGSSGSQIESMRQGLEQLTSTPSSLSGLQLQAEFENYMKSNSEIIAGKGDEERKELDGSFWWSGEMENKSSASISSNSWDDSYSVINSAGGNLMMFHDYGLGYNM